MRSAVPFLITNKDTVTNSYQVTFTAESWEDVGSAADWVPGTFIFEQKGTEEPTIREMLLPSIYDSALGKYRPMNVNLSAVNVQGIHAGIVERTTQAPSTAQSSAAPAAPPPPPAPTTGPGVIAPIEFKARLPFSEGFDPPMKGDVDHLTGAKDFDPEHPENWIAWTSVAKSGPLNVNLRTKLVFPKGWPYWNYEIIMADENGNEYSSPSLALASVDEYTPWAEETPLTIHGLPGSPDVRYATILVRTNDAAHQVAVKMKVMVLPHWGPIDVKFYVVRNSKTAGYKFQGQPSLETASDYVINAPGVAKPADIIAEINERMKSCAVTVASDNSAPDKIVPFDTDHNYTWSIDEDDELKAPANRIGGKCAFLYLPSVGEWGKYDYDTKFIGIGTDLFISNSTSPKLTTEDSLGAIQSMKRVCAHEFGHFLTMSTREWDPTRLTKFTGHDYGPYPKGTVGLMRGGTQPRGRWTRHEDWEAANKKAKSLFP